MMNLTELFCNIDDFWKKFEKLWKERLLIEGKQEAKREPSLCPSEVMTLVILFHIVGYRNFKTFYNGYVLNYLKKDFQNLPSYGTVNKVI